MRIPSRGHEPDPLQGIVAGVAGGILASFLMEQFQAAWSTVSKQINPQPAQQNKPKSEPATVQTANAIYGAIADRKIPADKRPAVAETVHYMMGATSGAIYGLAAELMPIATVGGGLAFGASVWMIADNVAVPAFGLAQPPTKTPIGTHIYALASHLVYGVATEAVRRAVRGS